MAVSSGILRIIPLTLFPFLIVSLEPEKGHPIRISELLIKPDVGMNHLVLEVSINQFYLSIQRVSIILSPFNILDTIVMGTITESPTFADYIFQV